MSGAQRGLLGLREGVQRKSSQEDAERKNVGRTGRSKIFGGKGLKRAANIDFAHTHTHSQLGGLFQHALTHSGSGHSNTHRPFHKDKTCRSSNTRLRGEDSRWSATSLALSADESPRGHHTNMRWLWLSIIINHHYLNFYVQILLSMLTWYVHL